MPTSTHRLFIVSNRLPVNITGTDEKIKVVPSSGGLVHAIGSFLRKEMKKEHTQFQEIFWAGVPGCSPGTWSGEVDRLPSSAYSYLPVFVNNKDFGPYYEGFSNSVIWPLFHYFPSYTEYSSSNYDSYLRVNNNFSETIIRHARPGDTIWIHDYHLLPLAALIRKELPGITIGFFLHIPFPSFEVFRQMPGKWQEELLLGMLGADLIGFHTIDYSAHFLQCIQMILGLDNDMNIVRHDNRLVKVDVFPISIDYTLFRDAHKEENIQSLYHSTRARFGDKKILFSVDRLDYTKGLGHRIKAYEHFLMHNPTYHGKVVFILVIVPSRDTISKYAERKKLIDESISSINGKIGTITWQPFIYQYSSLSFAELISLYLVCDLTLITPIRDGMNLVAKEFVASRADAKGVLVLSEMAGAARELAGALMINPNDIEDISDKIVKGLEMPIAEQSARMRIMQERVESYDINAWALDYLNQLQIIRERQGNFQIKFLDRQSKINLMDKYRQASRRLLLLDYDGTLTPFFNLPALAKPDNLLLELLENIAFNKLNSVYIISGRDSETLGNWLGHLPVNIVAEHGAKFRYKGKAWEIETISTVEWKDRVQGIMEVYVKKCPNSFIERKGFSLVWHYRNASPAQSSQVKMELFAELCESTRNADLQVMMGNKIIEVRNKGIDKGAAVRKILSREQQDFILAIGDDGTDEDMFRLLAGKEDAFTIKVGVEASFAQYNIHTPQMVISLLNSMNHLEKQASGHDRRHLRRGS